jgi:hypothetical protein
MKKGLLILILLTSVFTSCENEKLPPTLCDIKINELNKHSEDYDSELSSLGEEYFKTLDDLAKENWIKEGEECYYEYLISYGADTTNTN